MMESDLKDCLDCCKTLFLIHFGVDKRNRDGVKGICKPCERSRVIAWRAANADGDKIKAQKAKAAIRAADYYAVNKLEVNAKMRAYHATAEGKAKKATEDKIWREANKEYVKARQKAYASANREARNAYNRMASKRPHRAATQASLVAWRRAIKKKATPPWVDRKALSCVYSAAKAEQMRVGRKMHVDHIVPLVSPIVCGLHVPWNLQVLFYLDNHRKSNRHWPDMPE